MIIFYLIAIYAFLPNKLKDNYVIISNMKYPKMAITTGGTDLFHGNLISLTMSSILENNIQDQLFMMQESIFGGVVFKKENLDTNQLLRTVRHGNSLYLKGENASMGCKDDILVLEKYGSSYARTFRLKNKGECLDARKSLNTEKVYLEFSRCSETDTQIWGTFSNNQALDYIGLTHNLDEGEDLSLDRLIDNLDFRKGISIFG